MNEPHHHTEPADPNPEYLIKSIAEQGYSLETALADLIDNSISAGANKIEVMIKMDQEPFTLFLADNGEGMNEDELKRNMQFPSSSPESRRQILDLGRFGLGLKTASFSQTRCFTVITRKKGSTKYNGRTWDVELLKKDGWKLIVNNTEEIQEVLNAYQVLSEEHLNRFNEFLPNTIVVWKSLYKFETYLENENRQKALKREITEIASEYFSLVFHRFMERPGNPLKIRINNNIILPFNPFPTTEKDFRPMEYRQKNFRTDTIKMEGFILPARSIEESRDSLSIWTTKNRGLMDMEGIYLYRADRIILFGGWNDLIRKAPRLQLARLRVDVGNSVDHLLHLNVAKSQIVIPHDLKKAFGNYIEELKIEAEREYYNRGIRNFSNSRKGGNGLLFERKSSSKGILLEINPQFPTVNKLINTLNAEQLSQFRLIMRMTNTTINTIRQSHEDSTYNNIKTADNEINSTDLILFIVQLRESGISIEQIKKEILPSLGYLISSLPEDVMILLRHEK